MTIWEWMHDYELHAIQSGDALAVRMCRTHSEAYSHRQTSPQQMLEILREGRSLAERLREPWWMAFFDHWQLETLIYYLDDYRDVIERAVKLTLEVRKPAFESYPLRFGIWCNLVAAYLCVDARGYADAVREALAYLQSIVPEEGGDMYLLQARRHWFAYELGEYAEAERLAREELSMCARERDRYLAMHHEVDTYKALCWIAFRREDWTALMQSAEAGEAVAREMDYRYELALFLLWRAACAMHEKSPTVAKRFCRLGMTTMARLGQPPGESYFDALATYYELSDDVEAAWQTREEELRSTVGKGQFAYEAQIRLKRLRLLRKRGRAHADELAAAQQAAERLRTPEWYLNELQRVLAG